MPIEGKRIAAILAVTAGLLFAFWPVLASLVDAWWNDGNYSHGFFIIPLAAYFAWVRREELLATPIRPSWFGLVVLAGSIGVLVAGLLGSELFTSRISLVGALAGIVLYLYGWKHLRILSLPLAFLLLMIPLPAIILNRITVPLQLLASQVGAGALTACDIPVLREGNVLQLANTSLEVAEACSGIRSLVSLITLGIVYGYFTDTRLWVRLAIVASTIPVAILANGARVAGTGIAAHVWGPTAAQGFFHEFSGWLVFIAALVMILGVQRLIVRLAPPHARPAPSVAA